MFFYNDGFDIEQSTKVGMPLNKETKPNPFYSIFNNFQKCCLSEVFIEIKKFRILLLYFWIIAHKLVISFLPQFILNDFNSMSTRPGLFYAKRLGITFLFSFLCTCFLRFFCKKIKSYQQQIIWHKLVWFQVFVSNTNDCMVSSNYFYVIIVIFLAPFIWFQVTDNNPL